MKVGIQGAPVVPQAWPRTMFNPYPPNVPRFQGINVLTYLRRLCIQHCICSLMIIGIFPIWEEALKMNS